MCPCISRTTRCAKGVPGAIAWVIHRLDGSGRSATILGSNVASDTLSAARRSHAASAGRPARPMSFSNGDLGVDFAVSIVAACVGISSTGLRREVSDLRATKDCASDKVVETQGGGSEQEDTGGN